MSINFTLTKQDSIVGIKLDAATETAVDSIINSVVEADTKAAIEAATVCGWKISAAAWLREKAKAQRLINEKYPRHAECYPSWGSRVNLLDALARELEE